MSLLKRGLKRITRGCGQVSRDLARRLFPDRYRRRGAGWADGWNAPRTAGPASTSPAEHAGLRAWFESRTEGRGIWKWLHYFEIYERHLHKFVGREVVLAEIGVQSGGSLDMWRHYFGAGGRIHGIDIDPRGKNFESDGVSFHTGDQSDRNFWREFRAQVPGLDILIDDGGHTPEQQRITLEEMLPHLRPGGVFLCEDIHGIRNEFASFVYGLADRLNVRSFRPVGSDIHSPTTPFQAAIRSIHCYPYVVVIELADAPPRELVSTKRGTEWLGVPPR